MEDVSPAEACYFCFFGGSSSSLVCKSGKEVVRYSLRWRIVFLPVCFMYSPPQVDGFPGGVAYNGLKSDISSTSCAPGLVVSFLKKHRNYSNRPPSCGTTCISPHTAASIDVYLLLFRQSFSIYYCLFYAA